ncbi:MAG: T9SS type A sorting domain-containing protein [Bacteroidales bacterium]|nr:T9SS type A sorting domain-containing protein [Bacteroidales bacterium]
MNKSILNKDLGRRLSGYAASAAALALIGTSANAQVIHSGPQNVVVELPDDYVEIDLDGDGISDFGFEMYSTGFYSGTASSFSYYNFNVGVVLNPRTDGYNNSWVAKTGVMSVQYYTYYKSTAYGLDMPMVAPLASNVAVDSSITYWGNVTTADYIGVLDYRWLNSWYYTASSGLIYYGMGEFAGESNYIGVRFHIGASVHYGWLRVAMAGDGSWLNIIDWAYESTANTGILTGDGSDNTGPSLSLSGVGASSSSELVTITINADEDIAALQSGDITVTNGTAVGVNQVSASEYEVSVQCNSYGVVTVSVGAGDAVDLYGNPSETAASISWTYYNLSLDMNTGEGISIYPNPVDNELFIELAGVADVSLISMNGSVVYQQERVTSHNINVSDFSPGVYLVQIKNDDGVLHRRVVIE